MQTSPVKRNFNGLLILENTGQFTTITKKKDDDGEKTVSATEFINRMISNKRVPDQNIELPKVEQPK